MRSTETERVLRCILQERCGIRFWKVVRRNNRSRSYIFNRCSVQISCFYISVKRHFNHEGRPIIGICNGFQILCESGILPGALIRNRNLKFNCSFVNLKSNKSQIFTSLVPKNKILKIPISHGEGNYQADANTLDTILENNQFASD